MLGRSRILVSPVTHSMLTEELRRDANTNTSNTRPSTIIASAVTYSAATTIGTGVGDFIIAVRTAKGLRWGMTKAY